MISFLVLLKNLFGAIPVIDRWISALIDAWTSYQLKRAAEERQRAAEEASKSKDTSKLEDLLNGKK